MIRRAQREWKTLSAEEQAARRQNEGTPPRKHAAWRRPRSPKAHHPEGKKKAHYRTEQKEEKAGMEKEGKGKGAKHKGSKGTGKKGNNKGNKRQEANSKAAEYWLDVRDSAVASRAATRGKKSKEKTVPWHHALRLEAKSQKQKRKTRHKQRSCEKKRKRKRPCCARSPANGI